MNLNKQGTIPCKESAGQYAAVRATLDTYDIVNCEHKICSSVRSWWWTPGRTGEAISANRRLRNGIPTI